MEDGVRNPQSLANGRWERPLSRRGENPGLAEVSGSSEGTGSTRGEGGGWPAGPVGATSALGRRHVEAWQRRRPGGGSRASGEQEEAEGVSLQVSSEPCPNLGIQEPASYRHFRPGFLSVTAHAWNGSFLAAAGVFLGEVPEISLLW